MPLLHTWSLGVEEQFYIIWPLLLFACYRVGSRLAVRVLVVALAAASLALVDKRRSGVFHVAGPEVMGRDVFARQICRAFALDPALVEPVRTASLGQKAPRPLDAGLRIGRVVGFGIEMRRPADGLAALREALGTVRG